MKKIFIFLTLFVCLFAFIFNNTVFASIEGINGINYPDLPSQYSDNDFIILSDGRTTYLIIIESLAFDYVIIEGNVLRNYVGKTWGYFLDYKLNSSSWVYDTRTNSIGNGLSFTYYYSTVDIICDGEIYFAKTVSEEPEEPIIVYPGISNTEEDLATAKFNNILITPGTFNSAENIDLYIYNTTNFDGDIYSQSPIFKTTLNVNSLYYKSVTVDDVTEFWYEIPRTKLGITFSNGNTYLYSLLLDGAPVQEISATIGGLSEEDVMNNNFENLEQTIIDSNKEITDSIEKQTEAIEENNKTNKNIFERIGDILSYINPFSENFFAYKLVELIVDGLKSLFIPEDNFFSNYFNELNDWFSERLGFLYYPLDLIFDLLDRFLNINFTEPILNIPDIEEPFTGVTLIHAQNFNFNSLLENETLKNVHDIYFIILDAIIYIGLVVLLYNKYEEVMTK